MRAVVMYSKSIRLNYAIMRVLFIKFLGAPRRVFQTNKQNAKERISKIIIIEAHLRFASHRLDIQINPMSRSRRFGIPVQIKEDDKYIAIFLYFTEFIH